MLFAISDAVAALIDGQSATPQQLQSIDYLAMGVGEGNHALTGKRASLRTLANSTSLSARSRAVFADVESKISQEAGIQHKVSVYGNVVVATQSGAPAIRAVGTQHEIEVPLNWINATARVQPAALLGENLDDSCFYGRVGEVAAILEGWGYVPVQFQPIHGGGGTIGQVLAHQAGLQNLCVCIVDSDYASPNGALGGTASAVQQYKTPAFPLIRVLETSGRDFENMLPIEFYIDGYYRSAGQFAAAPFLESLTGAGEIEARLHLDIKRGLNLRQIFAYSAGSPERAFWDAKTGVLSGLVIPSPTLPCLAAGICALLPNVACTCVIVPPSAGNILRQFLDSASLQDRFKISKIVDPAVRPEWTRLGREIASWCLGRRKLRV
jgi:hypothetical protein